MKIDTVNVIEYADDDLTGIVSFDNTDEGNKQAEEHFTKILKENDVPEADIESFIEDGYWEQGTYQIYITHSN